MDDANRRWTPLKIRHSFFYAWTRLSSLAVNWIIVRSQIRQPWCWCPLNRPFRSWQPKWQDNGFNGEFELQTPSYEKISYKGGISWGAKTYLPQNATHDFAGSSFGQRWRVLNNIRLCERRDFRADLLFKFVAKRFVELPTVFKSDEGVGAFALDGMWFRDDGRLGDGGMLD